MSSSCSTLPSSTTTTTSATARRGSLATNLPNVLWRDEFCKVEEEVMMEVFSDPIIFCHDDYAWLEAVKAWADNSEEKLERLLPAIKL